jgi:hypothetical protein
MEIWKPLRNFPSYNGSSEGRIMNIRTQRILKTHINEKGYEQVCLRKNNRQYTVRVHKVIAETFLGYCPDLDVRHRDNDRSNNRVDNLYWSTRKETIGDSFERGDRLPNRRTPVRVIETGETYESVSECSRATGCARSDIFKCMVGTIPHVKGLHFERIRPSY